ncbi:hypothetical protein [Streptomyces sp. x-19]|uniref:hypothetical protein n=1 Tax=Streptomyces sp. x-19 TaxID=2789280 RepID=UPI0039807FCF
MQTIKTLTPSAHRYFATATLITSVALATVLTGCGAKDGGDTNASNQVASLQKGNEGGDGAASSAKKYKEGSPEFLKALDAWKQKLNTCKTRKAQQLGIETAPATGKDEGEITTKEDMGPVHIKNDGSAEGSPLAKKWYAQVVEPCKRANPAPQTEDDGGTAAALATARKQYECLTKAGLSDLHQPTNDDPALFTAAGVSKYVGQNVDPKSKEILHQCGLGG